jgi:hypothetical protein
MNVLSRAGSAICRILEITCTPINNRYSIFVCPCTGACEMVELKHEHSGCGSTERTAQTPGASALPIGAKRG